MNISVIPVAQFFPPPANMQLYQKVNAELNHINLPSRLHPGMRVGITVGSRGINELPAILHAICLYLQRLDCEPVLVATMGSHGGSSASGQQKVWQGLGVTTTTIPASQWTGATSVLVGFTTGGLPAFALDILRWVDALIVVNRIKPHTSFQGPIQSGLLKMLAVGAGGPRGAEVVHQGGSGELGWRVPELGKYLLEQLPVVAGLALVENQRHQLALVTAAAPEAITALEQDLIPLATAWLANIPWQLDLLVLAAMGKCYSGTGMDTNVIGRWALDGQPDPEPAAVRRLVVLDLADASQGNANGLGLADITTSRLTAKVDWQATYQNVLTTGFLRRGHIPIVMPNDRQAIRAALRTLPGFDLSTLRMVLASNTLDLENIWISEQLLDQALAMNCQQLGPAQELHFDEHENLIWPRING